jgi:hypothetical protein
MHDDLRTQGLLPLTEPYTALDYFHVMSGGETTTPAVLSVIGNDAIVDWVVVELRHADRPSLVVASACALMQRDGDVVAADGVSPLRLHVLAGNYYVAIQHRNHLGTMSAAPLALSTTATAVDFTTAATSVYGVEGRRSVTGAFPAQALWSGDVNGDGRIAYTGTDNDRDLILQAIGGSAPTAIVYGYLPSDVNLDGAVKYTGVSNDRDPILVNIGGTVATNVRVEQLP